MVRYIQALAFFPLTALAVTIPGKVLVGHVQVLQSLKERFELTAKKSKPQFTDQTPTNSYLNAVKQGYLDSYYHGWSSSGYKDTAYTKICELNAECPVDNILKAEQDYGKDYYIFYHGQRSEFWLLQEFLKELYTLIKIHTPLTQFEFLRSWHSAAQTYEVNKFIDAYEPKLPKDYSDGTAIWNDTTSDLIKNMLCVNLSIFGNLTHGGESSFQYFMNNSNASWASIEGILGGIFDNFGFDKSYITQLSAQKTWLSHTNGILLQIFVPKNKVDQYVYLSKAWGTPQRQKFDATWNPTKKRHMKVSTLLEKYIKEPHTMGNFDQLQARILLGRDCMLNPDSGVKIIKYSTESMQAISEYRSAIKLLAGQVFAKALEEKTFKGISQTPLHKLLSCLPKK